MRNLTHRLPKSEHFFPKLGHFFSIFEKGHGKPLLPPHSSYASALIDFFELFQTDKNHRTSEESNIWGRNVAGKGKQFRIRNVLSEHCINVNYPISPISKETLHGFYLYQLLYLNVTYSHLDPEKTARSPNMAKKIPRLCNVSEMLLESLRNNSDNGNVNEKWQNYSNAHVHATVIPQPRRFLTTCQT